MAGYVYNSKGKSVAKLWKNGVATSLSDGVNTESANSVYVAGTDVYAVGYSQHNFSQFGKIWKNKLPPVDLSKTAALSNANSVFVSGNDVYVGGHDRNLKTDKLVAKYWKNGEPTILTDGTNDAFVTSIFVTENYKN